MLFAEADVLIAMDAELSTTGAVLTASAEVVVILRGLISLSRKHGSILRIIILVSRRNTIRLYSLYYT